MVKILSLCYPTYNRGWCIQEQINRLLKCPKEVLDDIEIIISDNCSDDNTKEIVESAISKGFICSYYRNETNLGMDGNFVSCFRKAKGKYVWLLGDDDYLYPDALEEIVELLKNNNYGLLHISNQLIPSYKIKVFVDDQEFCREMSYMCTLISANIPQAKYVKLIPFEKYMGTWFTLLPLYYKSLHEENQNAIISAKVFDGAIDCKRNGGYHYFEVFVKNYLDLHKEFVDNKYINIKTYRFVKRDIFNKLLVPAILTLLIFRLKSNYRLENSWSIVNKYYHREYYYYLFPFKAIKYLIYLVYYKLNTFFCR